MTTSSKLWAGRFLESTNSLMEAFSESVNFDHRLYAEDIAGYALSPAISVHWLDDGDHGFKPRKASGLTEDGNWRSAIGAIVRFLGALG